MEKYLQLQKLVKDLDTDFFKFYQKQNKASGTRLRNGLQKVKALCNEIRVEVQEKKKL